MLASAESPHGSRVTFEAASLNQIRHSMSEGADIAYKVDTGF